MNGWLLVLAGVAAATIIRKLIQSRDVAIRKGLNVVITGASSGIGAELARQYAKTGAHLLLCARRLDALAEVASDCRALGGSCDIVQVDVTVEDDCRGLSAAIKQKLNDRVDIMVVNAGIGQRGLVSEISDASVYKKLMDTNYLGAVYTVHHTLKQVNAAKGRIVVVSSACGRLGVPQMAGYSASKHALHGFFDALRNEGTNVSIVCPGFVATDMPKKNLAGDGAAVGDRETMHRGNPMPAPEAARRIMQSAAKGEKERYFELKVRAAVMLRPWLPSVVDWILSKRAKKAQAH